MPSIWKIKSYIHVIHVSPFLLKVEKTRQTSNSRCPTAKCNFNKHRRGDFQQPFGRFLPIVLAPDVGWRLVFDALDDCNMSQLGFCVKVVLLQPLRSAPQNSAFAHCQRTWGMYLEQMLWTIRCSCSKTKELREGLELSSCTPSGGKTSEANGHIEAILQTLVLFLSVGPPRSGHHQFPCFAIFENQWKLQNKKHPTTPTRLLTGTNQGAFSYTSCSMANKGKHLKKSRHHWRQAPSRFSNVGKPSPSPWHWWQKKTLIQNTPTEKKRRNLRPASASSSSYGVQGPPIFPSQKLGHLRNSVARKILHWKGIHILRVPSPRNHELRMHRRSGSSQYTALGQRLRKVRFVYHPIGRAENEIKSKLKVKDCLSTLRSKSTSYLPGLRIARTGSKPMNPKRNPGASTIIHRHCFG